MSTASVLIASDPFIASDPNASDPNASEPLTACVPRYTLLLSSDPQWIGAAQRLRYAVGSTEPGFSLSTHGSGLDADRFDEFCDHLLVRDDHSGELVGCYRMLPPPGAIAAGGLYTATEFDIRALDALRPSLVEMGRAAVRPDHRNGAVVLLMWGGILAYLDRCGYDFVAGCVSVPTHPEGSAPGRLLRGVRDVVLRRHAAPPELSVHPYRPVVLDGRRLDDIEPPARAANSLPPLMRGYLRLGAQVCGEPAHDPEFGVGDFPALLDKRRADIRYLTKLRAAAASAGGGAR